MRQSIRNFAPVFAIAVLLLFPLFLLTRNLSFRFDTDYKVVIPMIDFAIQAVKEPAKFLLWNPYAGLGMPVVGDPSSIILSPWYMPVFVLFGSITGLKILIALMIILSGFTMWLLLSSLSLPNWIAVWGALLYETSGAMAALVTSGRLEKFASYAIAPYVFLFLLQPTMTVTQMIIVGLLYATMYLSTDVYTPWLLGVCYATVWLYKLMKKETTPRYGIKEGLIIYGSFFIFSLPKMLSFFKYVLPYFNRLASIDAFEGSIHAWYLPLSYIIPLKVAFFDRPFFQRLIGFRFNWYEYFAFISIFPFIFLYKIRHLWDKRVVKYCLVLIVIGSLYLARQFWYSPFYWLSHIFTFTQAFRVPQRIVGPLLIPIIIICCISLNYWIAHIAKSKKIFLYIFCILSIVSTYAVSLVAMYDAFEKPREREASVATELKNRDPSDYFVLDLTCCMQPFLLQRNIPILNYYGGWTPTYTPKFINGKGDGYDFKQLTMTKPTYIVTDKNMIFTQYGYTVLFARDTITVWRAVTPTIFPNL